MINVQHETLSLQMLIRDVTLHPAKRMYAHETLFVIQLHKALNYTPNHVVVYKTYNSSQLEFPS